MTAACILIASMTLMALPAAAAGADLVTSINAIRARGCAGHSGVSAPLHSSPDLERAALALASGKSLRESLSDAGYRAVKSATLEVTGSDAAIGRALSERGCEDIIDPDYRDVGVAQRGNQAWIVLATPLAPPLAAEAEAVSRRVLELVNVARSRARRCGWKRFDAAAPLVASGVLSAAALAHSKDMADRSTLSHSGRDGSTPAERATRAGYRWRVVGENIASGQPTADLVVAEWLDSPRHCANLMSPDYSEMGVAFAVGPKSSGGIYWTQVFAAPA